MVDYLISEKDPTRVSNIASVLRNFTMIQLTVQQLFLDTKVFFKKKSTTTLYYEVNYQ